MVKKKASRKKTPKKSARKAKKTSRKKAAKKVSRKKATRKVKRKAPKKKARKPAKKRTARKKPAKKAARKPAKKRVARKKVRTTRVARRKSTVTQRTSARHRVYNLTREVPEHHYFVLANGRPVKHVAELASILDQLEDHVFGHHVTADRNDFHSWVKDIFEDVELARKITGVSDKKHLQLVIYRHLAGHD